MKTTSLVIAAWFLQGVILARADVASGTTKVVERFLGSNPEAYAILRTETEVTHDGGVTRTKTWLNEYPKIPAVGRTLEQRLSKPGPYGNPEINEGWYGFTKDSVIRSTLLADISQTASGDRAAIVGKSASNVTVHSTSQGPSMPDVMTRYPTRMPTPWTAEKSARLRCDDSTRWITCGGLTVFSDGILDNRLFGDVRTQYDHRPEYGTLAVEEVADDDNATFVTVSRTVGAVTSSAVIGVPQELSSHLRALISSDDHYLCAGTYKSRTEALARARSMRDKANGNPLFQGYEVEIWAGYDMNYCFTIYSVVVSRSMEIVRKREVAKFEGILGIPLALRSSARYQIRLAEEPEANR